MVASVSAGTGAQVQAAIASAAAVTGVDFAYLMRQARVESGLDPNARARTSSATGLYQFVEQSWLGIVRAHGAEHGLTWAADAITRGVDGRLHADPGMKAAILDLRRDPATAATMAAELASDNRATLESKLGRAVEPVDLYLAHFLGAGGATKFLRHLDADPGQAAAALFPAAARANHGVFYARDGSARSLAEVRAQFATKFDDVPALSTSGPTRLARAASVPAPAPVKVSARLAYLMLASLGV